jgi:hypothetical protein
LIALRRSSYNNKRNAAKSWTFQQFLIQAQP